MKKITILLIFIANIGFAQILKQDTRLIYGYLFVTDSVTYINNEYLVRTKLIKDGGKMKCWCYQLIDTTTKTIYGCEIPSPDRLSKISDLSSIFNSMNDFNNEKISLEQFKNIVASSTIDSQYKSLINSMQLINRKKFRLNKSFNNFR